MNRLRTCVGFVLLLLMTSRLTAAGADLRLVEALESGNAAGARVLLQEGVPVDAAQPDGTTALHWAARWNQSEIVTLLLHAGADVDDSKPLRGHRALVGLSQRQRLGRRHPPCRRRRSEHTHA